MLNTLKIKYLNHSPGHGVNKCNMQFMKQEYFKLKKVFIGVVCTFLPIGFIMGVLSLLNIVPVNINEKPTFGVKGLMGSVFLSIFISGVFSILCFVVLNVGTYIYNLFGSILKANRDKGN